MKTLIALLTHLLSTIAKLLGPGGPRAVVADSLLIKQQLLVINRSHRRAINQLIYASNRCSPLICSTLNWWRQFMQTVATKSFARSIRISFSISYCVA
jgi:hypothetical protein